MNTLRLVPLVIGFAAGVLLLIGSPFVWRAARRVSWLMIFTGVASLCWAVMRMALISQGDTLDAVPHVHIDHAATGLGAAAAVLALCLIWFSRKLTGDVSR